MTFILWTGEVLSPDPLLSRVEWLLPPLDVGREKQEWKDYRAAKNVLDRMPR